MIDLCKCHEYFQPEKDESPIHIIGCGSVGSTVADLLVRCGLKNLVLWDFDKVEPKNISNQSFFSKNIGELKVEATLENLAMIDPDVEKTIQIKPDGWNGEMLSGYVFLCVDSIEIRRQIVEKHYNSPFIKAMFDFRTRLEEAQHYAADWLDPKMKKGFLDSMSFTDEEAKKETPVSACNVELGVRPTVTSICSRGVANFMNFWNGKGIKKLILDNVYGFMLDAF